jgi:hypothetical protein
MSKPSLMRCWVEGGVVLPEPTHSGLNECQTNWTLRDSNALCSDPFWEAKRGLLVEFVYCRFHIDVE